VVLLLRVPQVAAMVAMAPDMLEGAN